MQQYLLRVVVADMEKAAPMRAAAARASQSL
jgi:hypothetical protein